MSSQPICSVLDSLPIQDRYIISNFSGPILPRPLTPEERELAISYNAKLIRARQPISLRSLQVDDVGRERLRQLNLIVENSNGRGFYLCLSAAMLMLLIVKGYSPEQIYAPYPFAELEIANNCYLSNARNYPIDVIVKNFKRDGLMEEFCLADSEMAKQKFEQVDLEGGGLIVRQRLIFPQLGKTSDGEIEEYGHYIGITRLPNTNRFVACGLLQPYGISGYVVEVDPNIVLSNLDGFYTDKPKSDVNLHDRVQDTEDINAFAFYPQLLSPLRSRYSH